MLKGINQEISREKSLFSFQILEMFLKLVSSNKMMNYCEIHSLSMWCGMMNEKIKIKLISLLTLMNTE